MHTIYLFMFIWISSYSNHVIIFVVVIAVIGTANNLGYARAVGFDRACLKISEFIQCVP